MKSKGTEVWIDECDSFLSWGYRRKSIGHFIARLELFQGRIKEDFCIKMTKKIETLLDYRSPSPVGFHPGAVVHNWRYGITRACINLECPVAKKVICEKDLQAIRAVAWFSLRPQMRTTKRNK